MSLCQAADSGCVVHAFAEGIVLVEDRDTEDGHDGIADELLDRPSVALDDRLDLA